jgi:hypothetical protein
MTDSTTNTPHKPRWYLLLIPSAIIAFYIYNEVSVAAHRNRMENNLLLTSLNLRQIGLAHQLQMGENPLAEMPACAICDAQGKPLLSWRVAILPFLGEQELYSQFHLDEPWDSPHNLQLVAKIPEWYCSPGREVDGKTLYLRCTGPETIWPSAAKAGVRRMSLPFSDIESRFVVAMVEADESAATPWTKPADLVLKPGEPLTGVGHFRPDCFVVETPDGATHEVPSNISADALRSIFTRTGGSIKAEVKQK